MAKIQEIYLYPGQWACVAKPARIATLLGSCVAVALHDPARKSGALNHYLLAELPQGLAPSTRYGNIAIPAMIQAMLQAGSNLSSLQAKVYGGGNVLAGVSIGKGIGNENVDLAFALLKHYGIPVLERHTGGDRGRKIRLWTDTFEVQHEIMEGR